jgi:hypothetical protein
MAAFQFCSLLGKQRKVGWVGNKSHVVPDNNSSLLLFFGLSVYSAKIRGVSIISGTGAAISEVDVAV